MFQNKYLLGTTQLLRGCVQMMSFFMGGWTPYDQLTPRWTPRFSEHLLTYDWNTNIFLPH